MTFPPDGQPTPPERDPWRDGTPPPNPYQTPGQQPSGPQYPPPYQGQQPNGQQYPPPYQGQQPPQGQYPPPYPGHMPPVYSGEQPTWFEAENNLGVRAMWFGIVGLACCGPLGIAAVVVGNKAKAAVAAGRASNAGQASAGVILGWCAIAFWALGLVTYRVNGF